jgi:outer membrane protein assembly factor BamB
MAQRRKQRQTTTYRFDDLALWKTKLPSAKHAVLPPQNNRPNPLVAKAVVYVSVFSEGAVCALERKSGQLLWRKEMPKYGGSAVHLAQGKLFAKTPNTLFALEPESGKTIWSFCPYGESGESIYSDPTVSGNRLFIGDRRGYLHCLDTRTGQTLWRTLTNTEKNDDVNTTPVVVSGLVVVGTNANMAAAYDASTGREVWKRKINGPSTFGPLLFHDLLVVLTSSVYLLTPTDGKIVRRFSWKGDGVREADCTQREVVCMLRGNWPPNGQCRLVGLNERGIRFTDTSSTAVAFVRCVDKTKLIYISHLQGIDVRRQVGGGLACQIELGNVSSGIGPVDVKDGAIYALTGDGWVYALKHPAI